MRCGWVAGEWGVVRIVRDAFGGLCTGSRMQKLELIASFTRSLKVWHVASLEMSHPAGAVP
ncbi:hypothetical protein RB213_009265, partial [Colletotrichum asianum]